MATREEHLVTRWELEASAPEVFDLLQDALSLPHWWPSVFLEARILEPGDERGVGRLVSVRTKAFLPWTLSWRYRVTGLERPRQISIELAGGLSGLGAWFFDAKARKVVVRLHLTGGLDGRLARAVPAIARLFLRWSHRWAMERGFTSLLLEVWRRRTTSAEARAWLPPPPGPAFPHNLRWRRAATNPRAPLA
jgi:hypothetical protein